LVAAFASLAGCAYVKPSPDAEAKQQYEAYGPKFTEEQKSYLDADEKAAIYNAEVRPEDKVTCRREKVLGSHFQKDRCVTQKEADDAKLAAETLMRETRGLGVSAPD
jgi:hypothetical protein